MPPRKPLPRFFPSRTSRGAFTESAALEFLREQGCELIERNVRFRVGEIDLVMRDGETLVFVEVRGRQFGTLESAEVALPFAKRWKLSKTIELYLARMDPEARRAFKSLRADFLSTNGRRWFWYRDVELRR